MSGIDKRQLIEHTLKWVDEVVIGFDFCPFAKFVRTPNRIRVTVADVSSDTSTLQALEAEVAKLDENTSIATTLIILPEQYDDFTAYIDLVMVCEQWLTIAGYDGVYQVASFHPEYQFEGVAFSDASHYTNRSPYPMLHIIREDDISQALAHVDDPESIPERNIELAREKGCPFWEEKLAACRASDQQDN